MSIVTKRPFFITFISLYFSAHFFWLFFLSKEEWLLHLGGTLFLTFAVSISTVTLFITYKKNGPLGKPFWLLLALGCGSTLLAKILTLYYEYILKMNVPFHSAIDVFYLLQILLFLLSFSYLFFKLKGNYRIVRLIFDMAILFTVTGTFCWVYYLKNMIPLTNFTPISPIISIVYPIADLVLLVVLISIYIGFETTLIRKFLFFIFLGLTVQLLADSAYIYLLSTNQDFSGSYVDSLFTLAVLLIGFSGITFPEKEQQSTQNMKNKFRYSRIHLLRPFIPYFGVMILLIILLIETNRVTALHIGFVIAVLLVITRQIGVIIENNQLLIKFQQRTNELSHNEQRYKSLFEYHPDAVFSLDMQGKIVSANEPWAKLIGLRKEELVGTPFLNTIGDDYQYIFTNHFSKVMEGHPQLFEIGFKNKNGNFIHVQFTNIPILVKNEIVGIYGIGKDITENKQNEEKIRFMAYHDTLTRLPNRALFSELLHVSMADADRNQSMLAVLLIDLDRFKTINDTLGHEIGDQLILSISNRLKDSLRKNDTIGRQGGDEFAILLKGIKRAEDAATAASKILHTLNQPYFINGHKIISTPSIGIALYPKDGKSASSLLKKADFAMYAVKEHGRNHYRLYSEEKNVDFSRQYHLEKDLHQALTNNELMVYYQPQFDIPMGNIIGVEALLRWNHPTLGMISPVDFIPIAEQTGIILPIGEWVLKTACQQVKEWHRKGYQIKMAVNLSPGQFRHHNLTELIKGILESNKLQPSYLDLEITEGIAMSDIELAINRLTALRKLGVSISIDDFGTGYSSLAYLTNYPVNTLKIAREFTQKIGQDTGAEAIIASIISLAHNLNLNVLAEGVEETSQLQFLQKLACNQVQGFMFGKPHPASELEEKFLLTTEMEENDFLIHCQN